MLEPMIATHDEFKAMKEAVECDFSAVVWIADLCYYDNQGKLIEALKFIPGSDTSVGAAGTAPPDHAVRHIPWGTRRQWYVFREGLKNEVD